MLRLRRFVESLLGIDPVDAGEDTRWHLRTSLGWPDWLIFLFLLLAVAFVVAIYLREGRTVGLGRKLFLAGTRLLVILALFGMLCGVEISIDRTGLPYLVVMVDDSESMSVRDTGPAGGESAPLAQAQPSRLEAARGWLTEDDGAALRAATQSQKLKLYAQSVGRRDLGSYIDAASIDEMVAELQKIEPNGQESRIGSNLRTVLNDLRGTPPSAVLLLTDGVVTAGEPLEQASRYAARKGIPVFPIGVGDPREVRDIELRNLLVERTVFVNDLVSFEAELAGRGFGGEDVTVALREDGVDAPLDEVTVRLPESGESVRVRLDHRPRLPGTVTYRLDVPVAEREIDPENNAVEQAVEAIDEKIHVLYVEGYPRYEYRYLKNLLEREASIEVSALLLDADPEYVEQDRAAIGFFPTSREELFEYDVVIFGDVSPSVFSPSQLEDVVAFVRTKGGGFVTIAGGRSSPQEFRETPLEQLLPVRIGPASNRNRAVSLTQGFRPVLTDLAASKPMFRFAGDDTENRDIWRNLPYLYWFARVERLPGAEVLAVHPELTDDEGQPYPLIATQFFGAGRTYFQAFDSSWRWRFRTEDLYHARYWVQTIRYLSQAKLLAGDRGVELSVDRERFVRGEPVRVRVRFLDESLAPAADDGVQVSVEETGRGRQSLTLSRLPDNRTVFEGVLGSLRDGNYEVRLSSPLLEKPPRVPFEVVPPPGELDRVRQDEPTLRTVAQRTGGRYLSLADANEVWELLPPGRRVALNTDPPVSLWNTWLSLTLFLTLLTVEWVVRKLSSML